MGIDTSLRSTGVAVVEAIGNSIKAVKYDTIKTTTKMSLSHSLKMIHDGIAAMIIKSYPNEACIEGAFYSKNVNTTMLLGSARGAAIVSCAESGIPVFEYSPRRVKQAVVGFGSASKEQVQAMITRILGLKNVPTEDESDAIAIAVCHLHNRVGPSSVTLKEL